MKYDGKTFKHRNFYVPYPGYLNVKHSSTIYRKYLPDKKVKPNNNVTGFSYPLVTTFRASRPMNPLIRKNHASALMGRLERSYTIENRCAFALCFTE